ncbi:hypothetical protein EZV62_007920 [Acer yangbiense]|uniref:Deoxyuridine 5'-triphosphate nucleotidohydrolase n=1 Tax=Acer yangbiense TaxID=1000413 RepID=A0A5C7IBU3_9ROSI|nr:hypothetical protein EZV62_007920 [Acer yangbiense]
MDTMFHNKVYEILRHESSFAKINATLQKVLMELQSSRVSCTETNPFAPGEPSCQPVSTDIFQTTETKVSARGKALVPTDFSIAIPVGTYTRVAPSLSLACKHSIDIGAGIIDADYRGLVGVIMFNHSDVDFEVKVGDRIAQLIIERIITTPNVLQWYQSAVPIMDTMFHNNVYEILARHVSSFAKINTTLQKVITELQSLRVSRSSNTTITKTNPFARGEPSHQPVLTDISHATETKVSARGKMLVPTDFRDPLLVLHRVRV